MKYYCIGIKGAGMSTLANTLKDLGNEVSGYDDNKHTKFTEVGLNKRNIKINYEPTDLDKDTIVTYSKAFKQDHPEIKRCHELGLEFREYNQVVGDVTRMFKTIAVAGTHGKTTTSLLTATVLDNTIGCNFYVGDGTASADANKEYLVIEADEYNKHLLAYTPYITILTNIEEDHLECYPKGIQEIRDTFEEFANRGKYVVACADDPNIALLNLTNKVYKYGIEKGDVQARNVSYKPEGVSFDVYRANELFGHFDLALYGKHMIEDALATITVSMILGISYEETLNSMKLFKGAFRRFKEEVVGDNVIIDDYAHHPSEITATINAAKQKYPDKEMIGVFLPNTFSRTKDLFNDFITSLSALDKAYVTPITSDREKQEEYPGVSSDNLVKEIKNAEIMNLDEVDKLLKHHNACILFMSCGSIYLYLEKYKELING